MLCAYNDEVDGFVTGAIDFFRRIIPGAGEQSKFMRKKGGKPVSKQQGHATKNTRTKTSDKKGNSNSSKS